VVLEVGVSAGIAEAFCAEILWLSAVAKSLRSFSNELLVKASISSSSLRDTAGVLETGLA